MALVTAMAFDSGTSSSGVAIDIIECQISNLALARIGADFIKATDEDTPSARQCRAVFAATRDELMRDYPFNFAQKYTDLVEDTGSTIASTATHSGTTAIEFTGQVANALVGMSVSGTGIATGAKIVSNTITAAVLSLPSTASGTVTITLTNGPSGAWAYSYKIPTSPVILKILEIGGNSENPYEVVGSGTNRRLLCNLSGSGSPTTDTVLMKYVEQLVDPALWDSLFKDALILRLASKLAIPLVKRADLAQFLQGEFAAIFSKAQAASSKEQPTEEGSSLWTDRTASRTR